MLKRLKHRPLDDFRRIYADTAVGGSAGNMRCGIDFFGPDRVLFASDCPFDLEGAPGFIRDGMKALASLDLTAKARMDIQFGNACGLLGIS